MKRLWAVWLKQSVITLAIVFALGAAFDHFTQDEWSREPLQAGLITVLLYCVVVAVLSAFHGILGAIYMGTFSHNDVVEGVLDDLRKRRLPAPSPYDDKTLSYLSSLADDEFAPVDVRVRAAVLYGQYNQAIQQGGIFRGLGLQKAVDRAIFRYANEGPQRKEARSYSEDDDKWASL